LKPQVFILDSCKRNPDGAMNQGLNLLLNRFEKVILDGDQRRKDDTHQKSIMNK
jgi:hypothetical protein